MPKSSFAITTSNSSLLLFCIFWLFCNISTFFMLENFLTITLVLSAFKSFLIGFRSGHCLSHSKINKLILDNLGCVFWMLVLLVNPTVAKAKFFLQTACFLLRFQYVALPHIPTHGIIHLYKVAMALNWKATPENFIHAAMLNLEWKSYI